MSKYNLLDCTLRDGGYIVNWDFEEQNIKNIAQGMVEAKMDYVEIGYLNNRPYKTGSSIFNNIEQISSFIPKDRKNCMLLAMADVTQFTPSDLTPYTGNSIDGIRVVFYKRQVREAMIMCKAIQKSGYKLLVQPMVTIDYSMDEYSVLAEEIAKLSPYSVAIVDSFGYMVKEDFRQYFRVLDNCLSPQTKIGFHSHNNMQLAFITAQDILDYQTSRDLIIDASLYGMGRGAGNLNTELIANYYNTLLGYKYDISLILKLVSDYIMPIAKTHTWGYSPYMFLTGYYHCHPNFAAYLLEKHDISVSDFEQFIKTIPTEMLTKCTKPYVEELYQKFIGSI
ncbi:MAG: aldolase catalytic domain-containing protein [Culturomica sp.]|jgi:4-hydroxy 2-oxovalerate aldolase|nr:aldolase catalytic domain-containing protein [Culturomica sp.]